MSLVLLGGYQYTPFSTTSNCIRGRLQQPPSRLGIWHSQPWQRYTTTMGIMQQPRFCAWPTFWSAHWECSFLPDLCWVSSSGGRPLPAGCQVLDDFPCSQHRPSSVHVGLTLPVIRSMSKKRWNFLKANWDRFAASTEKSIPMVFQLMKLTASLPEPCPKQLTPLSQGSSYYVRTLHGWGSPDITGQVRKIRRSRYCWPPYWVSGCCEMCQMGRVDS